MTLALFDFDGTLTRKDSFPAFLTYMLGATGFAKALIKASPTIVAWKYGRATNQQAKEALLSAALKGKSQSTIEQAGQAFAERCLPKLLRPQAEALLQKHQALEHETLLVSASPDAWMNPIAKKLHIKLISSRLAYKEGIFLGKLQGKNCYGQEKVERIKQALSLDQYSRIYAYGDSRGDKEMLELASHPRYQTLILPES